MDKYQEIAEKTERLMSLMAAENLGGVLVGAQHNFAWLTGGGTNGVDGSRDPGVGSLFIRRDGRRFLLANNIEVRRLLVEELDGQDYEPIEFSWEDEKADATIVARRAAALVEGGQLIGSDVPLGNGVRVIENLLSQVRCRLTNAEVERLRVLARDAGSAIGEMARALEPGVSEREIVRRASDALAAHGARAVVALAAADERLKLFRHPVPTDKRWERVAMIAVCARRGGLTVSLTRIVCAGNVPNDLRDRTRATAEVNARLFDATRPGATGRELYEVVARAYSAVGFPGEEHLHHQGGAIGYRTREWVAHPRSQERVENRGAFAWNPSITGTKVEETVIVLNDSIEVITASPDWPRESVSIDGREYILPGVLAL
ncbi:MAG: M24 family metallopeptidase [Acidobacteriota bacterium]|nr:M24 family metallopeptidase [Acidobacteriota bacterium]